MPFRLPAPRRRGVTLIEIMISVVILSVVLLGMGRYLVSFSQTVRTSEARTMAVALASSRISEIRASPNYSGLETNYATTETSITGFPGFTRSTTITHLGGPRPTYTNDYKTVTVVVTAPGIAAPIKKTIIVAAP
ncbi:MAG: prepilin-type N-terminal cleavage/methylation domain-containing protein [Gemmatimonadales bacterium]|jgi:prepilin-type N-terminal cleavage/methylation domain-containing protein